MKTLAIGAFALLLCGCVNIGSKSDGPAFVYHVLEDAGLPSEAPPAEPPAAPLTLVVLDAQASSFYDGDQLVFSRVQGTRGQYQFARWTERPGKRLGELMRVRLDRHGAWQVSRGGGYVRGDRLLDTALLEFYHDASSAPGQVRVVLRAELVDLKAHRVIGRRVFEQQAPLDRYDASGAAKASSVAVGRLLDDLVVWLASAQ